MVYATYILRVEMVLVGAAGAFFCGYVAWFVRAVRNDGQGWRRAPRHAEDHWSAPDGRSTLPDHPFSDLVSD
jgi:hypothetical protein